MSEFANAAALANNLGGAGADAGFAAPAAATLPFKRAGHATDALRTQNPFTAGTDSAAEHPAAQIQKNLQSRRFQAQVRTIPMFDGPAIII